jgi:serine/threonine-protein kinase
VELVPLGEATLARARAFARAGHRGLQAVLRIDRDAEVIWLEAIEAADRSRAPLTAEHKTALTEALVALHGQGAVHGHVESASIAVTAAGEAKLLFARAAAAGASADDDRLALARLLGATERA